METFVINLERRPDRLNNFLQNFPGTSNEKQIKIFKGVDGQVLHTSPSHNRESIELYEKLKKKLEARKKSFRINKGEVGCLLSHALLWQKIKGMAATTPLPCGLLKPELTTNKQKSQA